MNGETWEDWQREGDRCYAAGDVRGANLCWREASRLREQPDAERVMNLTVFQQVRGDS